ncbi:MAG: aminopeptidase [Nitrospiraceae bacterium]|nr:aminopeptidase [Nitrospiraceae bacterium]
MRVNTEALKNIYLLNLGVSASDKVLVFTDRISKREKPPRGRELKRRQELREISRAAAAEGRKLAGELIYKEYSATGAPAVEPPKALWAAAFGEKCMKELLAKGLLKDILKKNARAGASLEVAGKIVKKYSKDAVDAVVALSNYSTTHTTFRKLLTGYAGTRYASMPLFDVPMLKGPMGVDYAALKRSTRLLANAIKGADRVEVTTPNGTRLLFRKGRRKVHEDNGDYGKLGAAGNLPAGEVYLAPIEGTANGRLVLEWAPTRKLKTPVTLLVKDGMVVEVEGADPFASYLKDRLSSCPECSNIAELGIGTNPMATRPDNILESEKILGTIHIALGDNHTFGGKVRAPFHQDFVFFAPTLKVFPSSGGTGRVVIKKGRHQG